MTQHATLTEIAVRSALYTVAGTIETEDTVEPGQIDPRHLAERMYALVHDRDAREVLMTPWGEVIDAGAR